MCMSQSRGKRRGRHVTLIKRTRRRNSLSNFYDDDDWQRGAAARRITTTFLMSFAPKSTPLVASGHTRPVTHLSFSALQDDRSYLLISSCKDGNPMLREWTGDWIGTFLGHKGAVWSTKLSPDASRAASGSADFTAYVLHAYRFIIAFLIIFSLNSKVWDTYSGNPLHSFPHNHIVRSVALSPTSTHLLTGGQEKKVRMFDLGRPDADPDYLTESGVLSHDGTVKSVVWVGDHTGVTAGEDGLVKCVFASLYTTIAVLTFQQMVGSTHANPHKFHELFQTNHLYGIIHSDWTARRDLWQYRGVCACAPK